MKKKVVIATHVFSYGKSQALRDYLEDKAEVLFIGHPLFGNLFTWAIGAIDTLWQVIRTNKKFDLYVGSNNLNSFVGILLKILGRVKIVIFYNPDSPPNKFRNRVLNNFYHWMDAFCVRYADLVWNNSDRMIGEREKRGLPRRYRNKQIEVPMGAHLLTPVPFNEINRYLIGFVGHLKANQGLELMIDALPEIMREIPEVKLLIVGTGPIEVKLKSRVKELELKNVEFAGYTANIGETYDKLAKCAIAVAPYPEFSHAQWTDPGKVKVYFSLSLPVVITDVPAIAQEVAKEKCGIMIRYDCKELVNAIVILLKNEALLRSYRENTRKLAEKYSWDNIFKEALSHKNIIW
jgi:glycosyltransferase involved in cell wall biosynthesis